MTEKIKRLSRMEYGDKLTYDFEDKLNNLTKKQIKVVKAVLNNIQDRVDSRLKQGRTLTEARLRLDTYDMRNAARSINMKDPAFMSHIRNIERKLKDTPIWSRRPYTGDLRVLCCREVLAEETLSNKETEEFNLFRHKVRRQSTSTVDFAVLNWSGPPVGLAMKLFTITQDEIGVLVPYLKECVDNWLDKVEIDKETRAAITRQRLYTHKTS